MNKLRQLKRELTFYEQNLNRIKNQAIENNGVITPLESQLDKLIITYTTTIFRLRSEIAELENKDV